MAQRRGSRKLALDVLYEQEIGSRILADILGRYAANPGYGYASRLACGVFDNRDDLDRLISAHTRDWSIERMPAIDRNLLRLALFEMLHVDDVPAAVSISEAVALAKIYSTEDSSRFVNGLLGSVLAGLGETDSKVGD